MNKILWAGLILITVIAAGGAIVYTAKRTQQKPTSFAECAALQGRILESYPEQCVYDDLHFTNPTQTGQTPSETTEPLSQYKHPQYNFNFSYPEGWKLAEYTSRTAEDLDGDATVLHIALDPEVVGSQGEFLTLDKPMGMVMLWLLDGPLNSFSQSEPITKINNLNSYQIKNTYTDDASNPAYQYTTEDSYYLEIPKSAQKDGYQTLSVRFVYPDTRASDTKLQTTLQNILQSINFTTN